MKPRTGYLVITSLLLLAALISSGCKSAGQDLYHTVSFEANGGTPAPANQSILSGESASPPPAMSLNGHSFGGWYTSSAFSGSAYGFSSPVSADLKLYARWQPVLTPSEFTVTFMNEDAVHYSTSVAKGEEAPLPGNNPVKDGYAFIGWFKDLEDEILWNFDTAIEETTFIYAGFILLSESQAVISFDSKGGPAAAPLVLSKGQKAQEPEALSRDGHVFKGWFTDTDLSNAYDWDAAVNESFTLYAKWEALIMYTVKFITGDESVTIPDQSVEQGKTLSQPGDPDRAGYVFIDWHLSEGLNDHYDFNSPVVSDLELYAEWYSLTPGVIVYTVSFYTGPGASTIPNQIIPSGGKAVKPADPSREHWIFRGWFTEGTYLNEWDFGNGTVSKSFYLYAKWEAKAVVSFDSKGGSSVAALYVEKGNTAAKPADPVREHWVFKGWFTDTGLSSACNWDAPVADDLSLYAKWEIAVYTLQTAVSPAAGGTLSLSPSGTSFEAGTVVSVSAVPAKEYVFKNWSGASTATVSAITVTMDGNKTLEAVFEEIGNADLRIYINSSTNPPQFEVAGQRIWINGTNTPWDRWDDFGSTWYTLNTSWWDAEFARLKAAGINATRVWMSCKSAVNQLNIGADGTLGAPTARFWSDLDKLFELASKHKIYIMATLVSFDHFKNETSAGVTNYAPRWRAMLGDNAKVKSFVDNYTIPFVNRYKSNPYLWSIDICNEPDWINEEEGVAWNRISYFLAANAAAIHEHSSILVTVGIAYAKWQTGSNNPTGNSGNAEGNKISDQYLKGLYNNDPAAVVDFWSPHYYTWNAEWYGVANYLKPYGGARQGDRTNGYYGGYGIIVDANNPAKPAVIGEGPSAGTTTTDRQYIRAAERPPVNNIVNDFQYAFDNGWQGVMPWSSNGVDGVGNLGTMKAGTLHMEENYPALIFPLGK